MSPEQQAVVCGLTVFGPLFRIVYRCGFKVRIKFDVVNIVRGKVLDRHHTAASTFVFIGAALVLLRMFELDARVER